MVEISVGNLVSILVFIGGLFGTYIAIDRRVTKNEVMINTLKENLQKLESDIIERLDRMENRIEKLFEKLK